MQVNYSNKKKEAKIFPMIIFLIGDPHGIHASSVKKLPTKSAVQKR
jgi:hypothetical protein